MTRLFAGAKAAVSALALGAAMPAVATILPAGHYAAAHAEPLPQLAEVRYRTIEIDGLDIAYREAGDPSRPTVLLLHGFPTSSHMFRNLIPVLATRYHVIAPDYPGYGASEQPARSEFDYSFASYAELIENFADAKNIDRATLYLMDYGAPVGFRFFAANPDRVDGFIIQNGNAYAEGLEAFWDPIKAYWETGGDAEREALRSFLSIDVTQWQYTHGVGDPELVSWDNWRNDQYRLDAPENQEIQLDLFYDYRTNVDEYPLWQALFREHQPPAIILWGKNDYIFPEAGAHPYARDLETLETHILDTGHFALDEYGPFIAQEIADFLDAHVDQD